MMSEQREILLSQRFFPEFGGSIRWFYELFRRRRELIEVICHDYSGGMEILRLFPPTASSGMRITRAQLLQSNWGFDSAKNALRALRLLVLLLQRLSRCERIFAARIVPEGILAVAATRLFFRDRSLICFAHGEEILACESSRQLRLLLRWTAARVDLVLANSNNTKALLAPYVPAERIVVFHPGVSLADFHPLSPEERTHCRAQWDIPEGATVLLTLARLEERKNQAAVLRALESLQEEFPTLFYCLVGEGPQVQTLEREVDARGLRSRVRLYGAVSDRDRISFFQAADLFVMPSIETSSNTEGFGMVFLEAAACGLPSIAGRSGGQAEAVIDGETGLVVNGDSSEELRSALRELIGDRALREKLGAQAQAQARNCSWERRTQELEEILAQRAL